MHVPYDQPFHSYVYVHANTHTGEQKAAREVKGTIYQRDGEFLTYHLHPHLKGRRNFLAFQNLCKKENACEKYTKLNK